MKQIFALTSAMLAVEFTEQYSEECLFETLCSVGQKTGVKFDKVEKTYHLTGQWLSVLEAHDILLDFLLTENDSNMTDSFECGTSVEMNKTDEESDNIQNDRSQETHEYSNNDRHTVSLTSMENTAGTKSKAANQDTVSAWNKVEDNYMMSVNDIKMESPSFHSTAVQASESHDRYIECHDDTDRNENDKNVYRRPKRKSVPLKLVLEEEENDEETDNHVVKSKREKPKCPIIKLGAKKKRGRKKKIRDPNEEFKCPGCDYVGKTLHHLKNHMKRLHDVSNKFKCDLCNKSYGVNADLNRHKKSVHETPLLFCNICNKSYKSKEGYDGHMKSHQENYIKPMFSCTMCKKTYSSKMGLAHHVKGEHLGMKQSYLCSICGQSFTNKASYDGHTNTHIGLKPHYCQICGKRFAFQRGLWEHSRIHDETCRYSCDVCGKMFRQNHSLKVHKKIHKEIRDHSCSICGKAFTQKQSLLRHERVHTGEKPFECLLCNKRFYDTSIIRRHMIFMHKKEPKKWQEDTFTHEMLKKDTMVTDGEAASNQIEINRTNATSSRDFSTSSQVGTGAFQIGNLPLYQGQIGNFPPFENFQ